MTNGEWQSDQRAAVGAVITDVDSAGNNRVTGWGYDVLSGKTRLLRRRRLLQYR